MDITIQKARGNRTYLAGSSLAAPLAWVGDLEPLGRRSSSGRDAACVSEHLRSRPEDLRRRRGLRVGAASVAARGSQVGRRPSSSSFGRGWGGSLRRASGNDGGGGTLATGRGHSARSGGYRGVGRMRKRGIEATETLFSFS